jgi:hypothetical protein
MIHSATAALITHPELREMAVLSSVVPKTPSPMPCVKT